MRNRAIRTAIAALAAALVSGAGAAAQPSQGPPVVAIVLTDGKLLPFAVASGSDWQLLPWPRHEFSENQAAVPVPAAIPREWFAPLSSLPSSWRLQTIGGKPTAIHVANPAHWQVATFDAIGFATDYVDPDPDQRSSDFNAGIAVAGDVDTLPVDELDESSPQWAHLVARHAKAFLGADRADAKRRGVHLKGRTTVTVTKELRAGDVSLFNVALDPKHSYEYFEVTVTRPVGSGPQGPACASPTAEYYGFIERRGRTETVKWLSTTTGCDPAEPTLEIVGALRAATGVRLVVEYSGGDRQSFAVVNPGAPESQIRRVARAGDPPRSGK
ncbi:MAG TPA: hypothetical protein VGI12_03420 [Vicinamibacterales bacterium]|jgi:hypothetical protein